MKSKLKPVLFFLLSLQTFIGISYSADMNKQTDIAYINDGHAYHKLDLYSPNGDGPHPLIVWVHGGAWRGGSKDSVGVMGLVDKGWAIASIEYRLSPVAAFPAALHDIKAAMRFLRAHAAEYGIDAEHFVVAGDSAGGHLAALVGMSNGDDYLAGDLGDHTDQSSLVQGMVSLYGASNFATILKQSTPHGLKVRVPALELFIGGHPDKVTEMARLASPVTYVASDSVPSLLMHGDQDPQMPINQTHELHGKLKEAGVTVHFEVIHGAAHGGSRFYDAERIALMDTFLRKNLNL